MIENGNGDGDGDKRVTPEGLLLLLRTAAIAADELGWREIYAQLSATIQTIEDRLKGV